jgi:hypothetical protein
LDRLIIVTPGIGTVGHDHYPVGSETLDIEEEEDVEPEMQQPTSALSFFGYLFGEAPTQETVRIHFLDPLEYINGRIYYQHPELIPLSFNAFRIIHANDQSDSMQSMKNKGLWFVSDDGKCVNMMNL